MLIFWLSALRAIVEMLALCLLGQGVLWLISGRQRVDNPVYRFLAFLTFPPRQLLAHCLPVRTSPLVVGCLCFLILLLIWLGLAFFRQLA